MPIWHVSIPDSPPTQQEKMVKKYLSRRQFLLLTAAVTAGCRAPAMTPTATPSPAAPTTTPSPAAPTATPSPAAPTATPSPAAPTTTPSPAAPPHEVIYAGTVAPNVVTLRIDAGQVIYGQQMLYTAQAGDQIRQDKDIKRQKWVYRAGKCIGALVGPNNAILYTFDRVVGEPLDVRWVHQIKSYALRSDDDPAYARPLPPITVSRKSRPTEMARVGYNWQWAFPITHTLYLQFPTPLTPGKTYELTLLDAPYPGITFQHDPLHTRSEAVHVSQIGFRPDDPVKVGYLSCWTGSVGIDYAQLTRFYVIDESGDQTVMEGKIALSKKGDDRTEDPYQRNYNLIDVYRLDFSALRQPGVYRLCVDGVGCSYPFSISEQAWQQAFETAARGLYHQRSGIELRPPYTWFTRPRCFHPDDGVTVYHSTCTLLDSGNGLNARGTDKDNFGNLVAGKTDQIVPDAWGGYADAGDWDRRIQHLEATRLLLELVELFPDWAQQASLNLPESGNGLPDLVNEALWNLDCYRRMQTGEGGIRGGIESAEHPRHGEGSWQEQLPVMAYAPDMWSSYIYAGDAARAAGVLQRDNESSAQIYRQSALRAIDFAEQAYAVHTYGSSLPHAVVDARNLAAAELYRLTGDARWHDIFIQTTVFGDSNAPLFEWQHHEQRDAAFVYARTAQADERIRQNAINAIRREADDSVRLGRGTAFNWTKMALWNPLGWGALSVPQVKTILRAHVLTADPTYLDAAVLACQYAAGANPINLCFTTGVGRVWPQNPLWIDAHVQNLPPPPGLTVYGPLDVPYAQDDWAIQAMHKAIYPQVREWPTTELYFDVSWYPMSTEFTVMQTLGPNTYAWGYLAARA